MAFLVGACVLVVALVLSLMIKEVPLRTTAAAFAERTTPAPAAAPAPGAAGTSGVSGTSGLPAADPKSDDSEA